jgi:hypothetical protein
MIATEAPALAAPNRPKCRGRLWRSVRPSLLDLRFTGDPWVSEHADGEVALCLGDYRLVRLEVLPFDVPCLNRALLRLREARARAAALRRARA